jgi:hypothetical protein
MTREQVARYQALLGENPWVQVEAVRTLNPTTYLPEEEGEPLHSCEEILDEVFSSQPDLRDTAIPNANLELFTDGSRSLQEGRYWTRYAVTTITQVVVHGHQQAELYTLTRALTLADGKRANIYNESHYAFANLHIHGAIYKETGLLWSDVLPLALFKIRCACKKCGLSPFEFLYGWLPPLIPGQAGDLREYGQISLHKFLKVLVHASREIAWHLGHQEPN